MLLHKSAFKEILSLEEENTLQTWKKLIVTNLHLPYAPCVLWLEGKMRNSDVFRQGFLSCGQRDLGHYAVQQAIVADNLPVLEFLLQAEQPHLFCITRQGTLFLSGHDKVETRVMPNAFAEDESYLYTAIMHGSSAAVETIMQVLGGLGVENEAWRCPANNFCQLTTLLSTALLQLCLCRAQHAAEALKKVCILLKYGANPLLPDSFGATALTVYCENVTAIRAESIFKGHLYNKTECDDDKDKMRNTVLLLQKHIPVHLGLTMASPRTWSATKIRNPLEIPGCNGNTWLLYILLQRGVEIDTQNENGQNALFARKISMSAQRSASKEIITTPLVTLRFLIRHGINTLQIDSTGCTPITHLLLRYPNSDLLYQKIQTLFDGGVDIEHESVEHHTALSLATGLAKANFRVFASVLKLVKTLLLRNRMSLHKEMCKIARHHPATVLTFYLPRNLLDLN